MPRWLEVLIYPLIFALPSAIIVLTVWPIVVRRPIPSDLTEDAVAIIAISLALGVVLTLLFGRSSQTRARY